MNGGHGGLVVDPIRQYIAHIRQQGYAPTTLYTRERQLRRLEEFLEPLKIIDAREVDIDRWQREGINGCAAKARATAIAHVRGFYRWAVLHEHIVDRRDPACLLVRPRLPKPIPKPMAEKDLLLAYDTAPERIRPWIALAGWAGLRACEIAALRREDVLDAVADPVIIVRGKGSKERIVPIGVNLLQELRRYGLPRRGYVFPRGDGKPGPNQPHRISKLVNLHLHQLDINPTLHTMRHRFGTETYADKKDIRVVQELLGHSSPNTTAGYAAYSPAAAAETVRKLDRTLARRGIRGQLALVLPGVAGGGATETTDSA